MSRLDDSPGDMDDPDLTDDQIEALLTGAPGPAGYDEVAAAFGSLRAMVSAQPQVEVSTHLAEFVSRRDQPAEPEHITLEELGSPGSPMSPTPPTRRHRMARIISSSRPIKAAIGGAVALAAVTGVHAAGLVDVPLLPDESEPVAVLALGDSATDPDGSGGNGQAATADQTPADQTPSDAGTTDAAEDDQSKPSNRFSVQLGDGDIEIKLGDVSIAIALEIVDGVAGIDVEVEGVSPACEAAFESLEDLTDPAAMAGVGEEIEAACGEELGELFAGPGGFSFDHDMFEGPGFGMFLDENFDPGELEEFLRDWQPEHLEDFLGELDPDAFGGPGFGMFFDENFDPERLEEFLGDLGNLDPGTLRDGGDFGFFLDEFDPDAFGSGELGEFFEGLESGEFDRFFEGLESGEFGEFGNLFEDFGKFFEDPASPSADPDEEIDT